MRWWRGEISLVELTLGRLLQIGNTTLLIFSFTEKDEWVKVDDILIETIQKQQFTYLLV